MNYHFTTDSLMKSKRAILHLLGTFVLTWAINVLFMVLALAILMLTIRFSYIGGDEPLIVTEFLAALAVMVFGCRVGWKFSRRRFDKNDWIRSNPAFELRWRNVMRTIANLPLIGATLFLLISIAIKAVQWKW